MAAGKWQGLRKTLFRKTQYEPHQVEETKLRRCVGRRDVTALGVGSTLGVGVYVLIGPVAFNLAGPSIVLSFLVAAVAALLAGLCYAECVARLPQAGAAYSYTYLAIGEVVAFVVGWNNIAEALFGTATIARGLSMHLDLMLNSTMSEWFTSIAPISASFFSPYFDLFACFVVLVIGGVLAFGVREGMFVNSIFTAVNLLFVLFIVVSGSFAANINNWYIPREDVPPNQGVGGFFPFGVWGTIKGAAVCFYGFVGFDIICAAGEEVMEPRRVLSTTILSALGITFLCYTGVSIVFSMMVPYYLTGQMIAVAEAFSYVKWEWAKWIVAVGSLFGLYTSLFGGMFYLTRLMYSMSSDGLLLQCLSKVTGRRSPAILTVGCTFIIGIVAGLVEVEPLILMLCLGTLFSYTAVALSVVILRYGSNYTPGKPKYLRQIFGLGRSPTQASSRIVQLLLFLFVCTGISSAVVVDYVPEPEIPAIVLSCVAFTLIVLMMLQPQVKNKIYNMTPLVPLVPCISIYVNLHLMALIDVQTWIRVGLWTLIGLIIYFVTIYCCKRPEKVKIANNIRVSYTTTNSLTNRNGKPPVQIIVESPTPPESLTRISNNGRDKEDTFQEEIAEDNVRNNLASIKTATKTEEIIMHQSYIENNEEKEAKIIDLLDQVIQAEEDSYGAAVHMKEQNEDDACYAENMVQRKSISELSDAGSDASLGNHGLSKYDVIAQVHREDLPRVTEEEEKSEKGDILDEDETNDHEQVTPFNDSDSRTDESGYSDTIDRNALSESLEESKEEISNIPIPPPLPTDQNIFHSPNFKKSYTMGSKFRNSVPSFEDDEGVNKPRESIKSVQSNSSLGEGNLAFGSDRQIDFMSKLNNIFQNKMSNSEDEEPRKRSHSTGNVVENTDISLSRERSPMFLALKNEITSKEAAQYLRPTGEVEIPEISIQAEDKSELDKQEEEKEDSSLSKEDLKSKLENIFAAGGPKLLKPRLMKSNPPTPEDSYQTDTSSTESIAKLPKMEKNDTLKRQKDKFSEVLNSFRLSYNRDDVV